MLMVIPQDPVFSWQTAPGKDLVLELEAKGMDGASWKFCVRVSVMGATGPCLDLSFPGDRLTGG